MAEKTRDPAAGASARKNEPLGSRIRPDLRSGRPQTPTKKTPVDPRVKAVKKWSPAARAAAREAFERATAAGATRDEAIDAGHEAALRLELSPPAAALMDRATSLFGAKVVAVLPAGRKTSETDERCFERLFPDRGFPEPVNVPASPTRSVESDDEGKATPLPKDPGEALAGEAPKRPPQRQATFGFE